MSQEFWPGLFVVCNTCSIKIGESGDEDDSDEEEGLNLRIVSIATVYLY